LTLFYIKKIFRGLSFWSIIRTKLLSCSCFFLFLVEVELLLEGEGVGKGDSDDKEGREDEEGRPLFSLSA